LEIFVAHTSDDAWIAKQIVKELRAAGANPHLDIEILRGGDGIKSTLINCIKKCEEFVVLFTPWGVKNHNLSGEVGAAVATDSRVIAVTHNVKPEAAKKIYLLEDVKFVEINDLDEYIEDVKARVKQ
jgi:hypothetical protein